FLAASTSSSLPAIAATPVSSVNKSAHKAPSRLRWSGIVDPREFQKSLSSSWTKQPQKLRRNPLLQPDRFGRGPGNYVALSGCWRSLFPSRSASLRGRECEDESEEEEQDD